MNYVCTDNNKNTAYSFGPFMVAKVIANTSKTELTQYSTGIVGWGLSFTISFGHHKNHK
jgi:hypothetical protein